jgi:HAD superfamily hydrolase (TIGR01509 family)
MTGSGHAALVFDLDGTLIDTEACYRTAFYAAAGAFGLAVPRGLYAALVGIATPDRAGLLRGAFGAGFPVEAFFATYYEQRRRVLPARIPLCPGAAALLRQVRRPKAIATSASRRTALAHLARAGLVGEFAHVVTRDDVARGKPAPDSFRRAAECLGEAPEDCLAVEDSAHGVAAAHAAGMPVILIGGAAEAAAASCCRAVLPDLHALAAWLDASADPLRRRPISDDAPGLRNLA